MALLGKPTLGGIPSRGEEWIRRRPCAVHNAEVRCRAVALAVSGEQSREQIVQLGACDVEAGSFDAAMQRALHDRNRLVRSAQSEQRSSQLEVDPRVSERRRIERGTELTHGGFILLGTRVQQTAYEMM